MLKHYNIYVSGRVQGVGFRYSTLQKAKEIGINGFVRNMSDGSVYIEAEAEESVLDKFYLWCTKGKPPARVFGINFSESNFENFASFKIK